MAVLATLLINMLPQQRISVQILIRVMELLLLSAGLLTTIFMLKEAVSPCFSNHMMISNLRTFWFSLRNVFSSGLFICIIINIIVILIAASSILRHPKEEINRSYSDSNFEHDHEVDDLSSSASYSSMLPEPPPSMHIFSSQNHDRDEVKEDAAQPPANPVVVKEATITTKNSSLNTQDEEKTWNCLCKSESLHAAARWSDASCLTEEAKEMRKAHSLDSEPKLATPHKTIPPTHGKENARQKKKPPVQRDMGLAIAVTEETEDDDDDSMEATWRAITTRGPKTLQKCETWGPEKRRSVLVAQDNVYETERKAKDNMYETRRKAGEGRKSGKEMRKSLTFNETVSIRCKGGLMRDPSMSMEEFNGQVEAFIKNFNNEMRLQRQESEQRYLEMIKRSL